MQEVTKLMLCSLQYYVVVSVPTGKLSRPSGFAFLFFFCPRSQQIWRWMLLADEENTNYLYMFRALLYFFLCDSHSNKNKHFGNSQPINIEICLELLNKNAYRKAQIFKTNENIPLNCRKGMFPFRFEHQQKTNERRHSLKQVEYGVRNLNVACTVLDPTI